MTILLEVPVDDATGLQIAVESGADRIELCSALTLGGLTPSVGLMAMAGRCGVPVHAMIRPRVGDFRYGHGEIAIMLADISAARQAGLQGVVFGALDRDDRLDMAAMQTLCVAAQGMQITLHRAYDLTADWRRAVDEAVALGVHRILTSGHAIAAPKGAARLAEVFGHCAGRLTVMPGAGLSAETLPALAGLPIREIHASCSAVQPAEPRLVAMGFASLTPRLPDRTRIKALKQALAALTQPR